jgi:hypothetical protein
LAELLMPVIPATQDEIRRKIVQVIPRKKVNKTPSQQRSQA